MHDTLMPQLPSEYWNRDEETRAQCVYVGFCELAAATLDYAEGLSLLWRPATAIFTIGDDQPRPGAARLNWAATAFYYSLVHSARFLVFGAVGDFPTSHSKLPQAFCCFPLASTDWLQQFIQRPRSGRDPCSDGRRHRDAGPRYNATVGLDQLMDTWKVGIDGQQISQVQTRLKRFADALTRAKPCETRTTTKHC